MVSNFPPVHPVIVHFPVALFLLAGLFGFISLFVKREFWKEVLLKTLVAGAIFAPIAVVTGMIDEQKMNHGTIDPMLMIHKYNGIAIMLVFQILLVWFWLRKKIPGNKEYITWVLCLLLGTGMVLFQGYLGGELVFSKGMGVKPVEEAMGSSSGSEHGGGGKKSEGHDTKGMNNTKDKDDMKEMKGMDSKKGKDDMKEMGNSNGKDTYIINGNFYQYNMKDKDKVNDMKSMDNSKGKDDMKDMKGMDSKKGKDDMKGMNMNNPMDTFKFKDNNPAWKAKKKNPK